MNLRLPGLHFPLAPVVIRAVILLKIYGGWGVGLGVVKRHTQLLDELINATLQGVNGDVSHARPTRNEDHSEVASGDPSVLQAF